MRNATICVAPWGIAGAHWDLIRGVAAAKRHIYVIRAGKARAIPWIEKNFPGKPRELSAFKVNPNTGLLEAPRDRWSVVFAAGHLVLDQAGGGNWKLVSGRGSAHQTTEAPARIDTWRRHAKPGLVIQRESRLPFTSDYDLGAVLDTTAWRENQFEGHFSKLQPTHIFALLGTFAHFWELSRSPTALLGTFAESECTLGSFPELFDCWGLAVGTRILRVPWPGGWERALGPRRLGANLTLFFRSYNFFFYEKTRGLLHLSNIFIPLLFRYTYFFFSKHIVAFLQDFSSHSVFTL